ISSEGIGVDRERVLAIENLPVPMSKKKLQSFLGLYNYCSKFIRDGYKYVVKLYNILKLRGDKENDWWKGAAKNMVYIDMINAAKAVLKETMLLFVENIFI
ncbi:Retrovirus-related Pol polyprotein from transposon opus, partial [Nosema granulosis]